MSFDTDTFLVREHVGFLKLHEAYDILSTDGKLIGHAIERVSGMRQVLKLFVNKNMLPFNVEILTPEQTLLVAISRGFTFLRSTVNVQDAQGAGIGYYKQKLLSIGGAFNVFDTSDTQIATLKGDWKGWNFKFSDSDGAELGSISRRWGGLAKELFTSADNYVVHLDRSRITDVRHVQLLLAAAITIDMVLKETQ